MLDFRYFQKNLHYFKGRFYNEELHKFNLTIIYRLSCEECKKVYIE